MEGKISWCILRTYIRDCCATSVDGSSTAVEQDSAGRKTIKKQAVNAGFFFVHSKVRS